MIAMDVGDLRCEYLDRPLGIDVAVPRLSWVLDAGQRRGARQSAYRIMVASSAAMLGPVTFDRWDSGWVESAATAHVEYAGPALRSGERVHWTVAVRDELGRESDWAAPSWWEAGLLEAGDWDAAWIGAPSIDIPFLRTEFVVDRPVRRARLYATALGLYRCWINGARVGTTSFDPGWTDYAKRLVVRTFDVTELVDQGANALAAVVADGWYAGYVGFQAQREHWGAHPELLAQLVIEYEDGTTATVGTGPQWRASAGPLRRSDLLLGEGYDARLERAGWNLPGFDDRSWASVVATTGTRAQLVGPRIPGVEVFEERRPTVISAGDANTIQLDFGQNLAGWVRLRVRGPAGRVVRLRFAEVLGPHGGLHTENLRGALSVDEYVIKGGGEEFWEPWFTFHGFRYVEVSGWPGDFSADDITAVACSSALESTGTFACSSPMLNQLQSNIVWSQRANFLEVPTDCPQRDERLGWLGDAQVFARTAAFNQDVAPFFTKWLQDVRDAQAPDGTIHDVAPKLPGWPDGMPGWADAAVIVPWRVWESYGDTRILRESLPSCLRWLDHVLEVNPDGRWVKRRGGDVGDWLAIDPGTPKDLIATAYLAHSASLIGAMADFVGDHVNAERVAAVAQKAREAFAADFVGDDGRVAGQTQTAHVLALQFGLVPQPLVAAAVDHLIADIEARNGHLSVGFLGVEHLLPVLTAHGHHEVACQLALNETFPSWGHTIANGATTMWERWDGFTPENGLQNPAMNSFNHYAYGSVGAWLYRDLAGLQVVGPARFRLSPRPGPEIDWAAATYRSIWGEVACGWQRDDHGLSVNVTIPANASADLVLLTPEGHVVCEGPTPLDLVTGVSRVTMVNGTTTAVVAPGSYEFTVVAARQ